MVKRALLVVEGERTEKRLMKALFGRFFPAVSAEVYTYCTMLYELAESLFAGEEIDGDLDLLWVLRGSKTGPDDRGCLCASYTDIYLVFDMDPHHQKCDLGRLTKMAAYFRDSADEGRLYINYPMAESYRHIPAMDGSFLELSVADADIPIYKEIADREGPCNMKQLSKIDREMFSDLIALHLRKYRWLTEGSDEIPNDDDYLRASLQKLPELQVSAYRGGQVYVLNTSLFSVIDYNPSYMLGLLSDRCIHERVFTGAVSLSGMPNIFSERTAGPINGFVVYFTGGCLYVCPGFEFLGLLRKQTVPDPTKRSAEHFRAQNGYLSETVRCFFVEG